jgi:hypothetical protein
VTPDGGTAWIVVGTRARLTERSVMRGSPSFGLQRWSLDGTEATQSFSLPLAVREITPGHDALWLTPGAGTNTKQFVLIVDGLQDGPRSTVWHAPKGHQVVAVEPQEALTFTVAADVAGGSADLSCYRLGG